MESNVHDGVKVCNSTMYRCALNWAFEMKMKMIENDLPVFKWPFEPFIVTWAIPDDAAAAASAAFASANSCAVCSRFRITVCTTSFSEFVNVDLRMPVCLNWKWICRWNDLQSFLLSWSLSFSLPLLQCFALGIHQTVSVVAQLVGAVVVNPFWLFSIRPWTVQAF